MRLLWHLVPPTITVGISHSKVRVLECATFLIVARLSLKKLQADILC